MAETYAQRVLAELVDIAGAYVRSNVRVAIKTNLGPEITVFSGALSSAAEDSGGAGADGGARGGLAGLLGLKAAVIVRDASGRTLATFGTPPPTEPLRALVAAGVLGLVVWVFIRGITK